MSTGLATQGPARREWRTAVAALAVAACAGLAWYGCTFVPDADVGRTDLSGNPAFDAKTYVAGIWLSQVQPLIAAKSVDASVLLPALARDVDAADKQYASRPRGGDGPWTFLVHGEGTIRAAETSLRHATVQVDVDGQALVLQIGPVIFGTALRDTLPFLSFDQVVNQIQYAQVSRELNDYVIQCLSVAENLGLASLWQFVRGLAIDTRREREAVRRSIPDLLTKVASPSVEVTALSGGNQHKVVIGKALLTRPRVLLLDEPGRGIDVGAKAEVFRTMRRLAAEGLGVIFATSDLKEVLAVADRILVMAAGRVTGDFPRSEATEARLVAAANAGPEVGGR